VTCQVKKFLDVEESEMCHNGLTERRKCTSNRDGLCI
jgi:hypothetical protein